MSKRLLVMSSKGGSSKSSLCRNLAPIAAAEGLRTVGVDTDPQGTFARWYQKREKYRSKDGGLPFVEVRTTALDHAAHSLDEITADLIVIDTPTAVESNPRAVKELILAADFVLVPSQPSEDDVASVKTMMATVRQLGRASAFVLTRTRANVKETDLARRELGKFGPVIAAKVPETVQIQRAMSHGLGITETEATGHEDIQAVWIEVRRLIGFDVG